jgi:hypothetical protein
VGLLLAPPLQQAIRMSAAAAAAANTAKVPCAPRQAGFQHACACTPSQPLESLAVSYTMGHLACEGCIVAKQLIES